MKALKRAFCLVLVLLTVCSLCACNKGSDSTKISSSSAISSSDAISAVINYKSETSYSIEYRIATALGFKSFRMPRYGTQEATKNPGGSWTVIIKGIMSGCTNEYADEFNYCKFKVTAEVSKSGTVSNIQVKKVY